MIPRYRWRRILEIRYREGRKEHYYFNRKSYKKIYQLWVRAKRLAKLRKQELNAIFIRNAFCAEEGEKTK